MSHVDLNRQFGRRPAPPVPCTQLARLLLILLATCACPAVSCRAAGLVIQAPDLMVTPGSSGSFDVLLTNTNAAGGASFGVSLDSLDLALSGSPGIAFTNVTIDTVVPYIYTVSATTLPGSDPLNFGIAFPNTGFTVADSDGASPFFQTVNPGDTFGLANVSYIGQPNFFGSGLDHDRQFERGHVALRHQWQCDSIHSHERFVLAEYDPRALINVSGRNRSLDRDRRRRTATARVNTDRDESESELGPEICSSLADFLISGRLRRILERERREESRVRH